MVLPPDTFSLRVDGCNTTGRTQHLQLVDDPGGSAQDDEDKHKDGIRTRTRTRTRRRTRTRTRTMMRTRGFTRHPWLQL